MGLRPTVPLPGSLLIEINKSISQSGNFVEKVNKVLVFKEEMRPKMWPGNSVFIEPS